MPEFHAYERRQFERLFKQEKIDRFEDRLRVLEAFLQVEGHVTAEELTAIAKAKGLPFSQGFVEETLELMCRFGFAQKNRFINGILRYEHRHLGQHHDHMICTKCGKIIEFKNDQMEHLQRQIVSSHGFYMLQHRMEIYGLCGECLKSRETHIPLVLAKQGERVVVEDFIGGNKARLRLESMGIRIGDEIEVITNYGQGQLVIAVGFQRYVLGQGMAQKIIVHPEPEAGPKT
jgi:Fur family transcriptional regulator, ferric uptake regulator